MANLIPLGQLEVASDLTTKTLVQSDTETRKAVDARIQGVAAGIIASDPTLANAAAAAVENFAPGAVAGALGAIVTPGLTAVSYGDSITFFAGYQPYVIARLNLTAYTNRGVSGRPMADGSANGVGTVTTVLANSDHDSFDLVTIAAGTNDFRLNIPLGTIGSWAATLDRTTFYGAYRMSIDHILTQNPAARIVLCTPLKRNNAGYTDESTNTAGHMLRDYAQAVRDVANMYGLPVCDWYNDSGFNERTLPTFTDDGLHPNAIGYARLGRFMGDYIGSVLGITPPPVIAAFDNFNRADSPLDGSTTSDGAATWWVAGGSVVGVSANHARATGGTGNSFARIKTGTPNGLITATLGAKNPDVGSTITGILARYVDGSNNITVQLRSGSGTPGWSILNRVDGLATVIATAASPVPAAGDIVQVLLAGTEIKVTVNETELLSAQVLEHTGSTYHGLYANGSDTVSAWDDWRFTP